MSTAAEDLAVAVRRLLDTAAGSTADAGALTAARRLVESATAELSAGRRTEPSPVHVSAFRHAYSIVTGSANALAPPVELAFAEDEVRGSFRLGPRYEGAAGLAHGGILCLVLDHLLGEAAIAKGVGGMTVGLDVRFVAPTRLDTDLEVVARVARVDGRKVHVEGVITQEGRATATATAVFLQIGAEKAAELFPQLSAS